jgi:hypothetical protein
MKLNNVMELISFRRDQYYTSPSTIEGEGALKIHDSMLLSDHGAAAESQSI